MRRATQLLLVCFYLASSVAVGQERMSLLLNEWEHASDRGTEQQINEGCSRLQDGYPRYREAKKVNLEIDFQPALPTVISPHVRDRCFLSLELAAKSHIAIRVSPSRAPPRQS